MWMYTVRGKELYATDVISLSALYEFSNKVDWLWVDCLNPDEKETEIISELLGNEKTIVNDIKERVYNLLYMYTSHEMRHDYALLSIPFVDLGKELEIHPVFIIVKEKMLITWGSEHCSEFIKAVIRRLEDHVMEEGKANSSFIISRLFREVATRNSRVAVSLREWIDKVEEEALEETGKAEVIPSVFKFKKIISTLQRLLWLEKDLMSDAKEGVIPRVRLDKEDKLVVDDAIDSIDRELEFTSSYDGALNSVLSLQNLGLIHRVESSINYLTIILVIGTIILIILELLAKLGIPSGGH